MNDVNEAVNDTGYGTSTSSNNLTTDGEMTSVYSHSALFGTTQRLLVKPISTNMTLAGLIDNTGVYSSSNPWYRGWVSMPSGVGEYVPNDRGNEEWCNSLWYTHEMYSNTADEIKYSIYPKSVTRTRGLKYKFRVAWQDKNFLTDSLNENKSLIQNSEYFPPYESSSDSNYNCALYNYHINLNDGTDSSDSIKSQLIKARAHLGLPVHGDNTIAKVMKCNFYNRYKTPDTNMAHNRTTTHVFFTRPDLNILGYGGGLNAQTAAHSETAFLYKLNPSIFPLLCDNTRVNDDSNNFNLLLSNQVVSAPVKDETLEIRAVGKNWTDNGINYGECYSGKAQGTFECTFEETQDLSVYQTIKLWITYIDNVSRGAWLPSYNLFEYGGGVNVANTGMSHVYTRTLDYASSCYVFTCAPDGETVLFWTKYYGVFPTNTGSSMLSWDLTKELGAEKKPNITFAYSYKKDMSPASLLEFNNNAKTTGVAESNFYHYLNMSGRPYVGCPFLSFNFGSNNTGKVSLKFKTPPSAYSDYSIYNGD